MAYYNKIGLLILNEDETKFLVCEPGSLYIEKTVTQYLMPGGQFNEGIIEECLKAEIKEELGLSLKRSDITYKGSFTDYYEFDNISYPTIGVLFIAKLVDPVISVSDDASDYKWFSKEEIPFDEIGFESVRKAVKFYLNME